MFLTNIYIDIYSSCSWYLHGCLHRYFLFVDGFSTGWMKGYSMGWKDGYYDSGCKGTTPGPPEPTGSYNCVIIPIQSDKINTLRVC